MDQDEARELLKTIDPSAAKSLVVGVAEELDGLAAQVWAFGLAEGARRALATERPDTVQGLVDHAE